jgi:hypothetical protein
VAYGDNIFVTPGDRDHILKTLEVSVKDILLFVISVEIMALRLGENKIINGIKVKIDDKAHIIKISQYNS